MKKEETNSSNKKKAHCESSGSYLRENEMLFDADTVTAGEYLSVVRTQFLREGTIRYAESFFDAKEAAKVAGKLLEHADREMFLVLSLDARNKALALEVAAIGTIDRCIVGVAEIFRHALLSCAVSIICFHNHPSGKCYASLSDQKVTERIEQAGEILGIPLLDHIILGAGGSYYSMAEQGQIKGRSGSDWNLR